MDVRRSTFDFLGQYIVPSLLVGGATVWAVMSWLRSKSKPLRKPVDLNNQGKVLPGKDRIHVHPHSDGHYPIYQFDDAKTLYQAFLRGLKVSNNGPCVGWREPHGGPYQWLNFQEVHDRAQGLGSGLFQHEVEPGQSTFIGIFAKNSPEWFITQLSCNMFSMVVIPLYETLGPQAIVYTINEAMIKTIVVDQVDKITRILDQRDQLPSVQLILAIEHVPDDVINNAAEKGITVLQFNDVVQEGLRNRRDPVPPSPSDLCIISYTSGSTGNPKGVMTSHSSMMLFANSIMYQLTTCDLDFSPDEILISYLPMAHQYEQGAQLIVFTHGCRIGFFRGDPKLLLDDIKELKPTFFPAVPRVLNRIYDQVMDKVSSSRLKSALLRMALSSKQKDVDQAIYRKDSIWDKILLGKIQNLLGGRVRLISTASAPLSSAVLQFCRCALGCVVVEGYGQTENVSVTFQFACENQVGHVGPPVISMQVKLIDVPEMNYYSDQDQGEVCFKSPVPFLGYYKQPEKTAEAYDDEGWIHSGDIGEWLPNGCLKIIDRRKNIFKLSQGEYIAPEKIETIYMNSKYVMQVFVDGNSLESCILAVVVPDPAPATEWAKNNGLSTDMDVLCSNKAFKQAVLQDIHQRGKTAGLKSFEQVKDIHLLSTLFSIENGLLTPTMKNKRNPLRNHFAKEFQEMYDNLKK